MIGWVILGVEWYLLLLYLAARYFAENPVPRWLGPFVTAFEYIRKPIDHLFAKFNKR